MRLKTKTTTAAAIAALALPAAAFAADQPATGKSTDHGKATAPGQICKNESRKKTMHGKGKSPFAACVVGVKRAQREAEANEVKAAEEQSTTAPPKLCKDQSKKKSATDKKTPFAACVSGAAKAQRLQREAA